MPDIFKLLYDGFEKHGPTFIFQILLLFILFSAVALCLLWLKKKITSPNNGSATNTNTNNINVNVKLEDEKLHEDTHTAPEHTTKELLNHTFFRSIKKMTSYEIQHLDIKERLRRAIFRDFLLIKFTVIHNRIRAFIMAGDMNQMDTNTFHDKLSLLVTDIITEYEATALDEEIPEIVISKFNKWHSGKAETVFNFVNDICEADDWYVLNTVKFYSFLNQMVSILDLTLIDARKTLINLNGELDKVVYKGITSETRSHHNVYDEDESSEFKAMRD